MELNMLAFISLSYLNAAVAPFFISMHLVVAAQHTLR